LKATANGLFAKKNIPKSKRNGAKKFELQQHLSFKIEHRARGSSPRGWSQAWKIVVKLTLVKTVLV